MMRPFQPLFSRSSNQSNTTTVVSPRRKGGLFSLGRVILILTICLVLGGWIDLVLASSKHKDSSVFGDHVHEDAKHLYDEIHAQKQGHPVSPGKEEKYTPDNDPYLFFAMHDANFDGYLDGHELLALFAQYGHEDEVSQGGAAKEPLHNLPELEKLVTHSLEEDDLDNDGRISKEEFLSSEYYNGS